MIGRVHGRLEPISLYRSDGMRLYVITHDRHGLLRVTTTGFWSLEELETYIRDLRRSLPLARETTGHARMLLDLRCAAVHSREVTDRFSRAEAELFVRQDRRAFVVGSSLKAMQLRRSIVHPGIHVFMSMAEGEAWLLADPA